MKKDNIAFNWNLVFFSLHPYAVEEYKLPNNIGCIVPSAKGGFLGALSQSSDGSGGKLQRLRPENGLESIVEPGSVGDVLMQGSSVVLFVSLCFSPISLCEKNK